MPDETPTEGEDLRALLRAVDVDVRCCLAFNRAILQALATISPRACEVIDESLAQDAGSMMLDDLPAAETALDRLRSARAQLQLAAGREAGLARELERALSERAEDMPDLAGLTARNAAA